MTLFITDLKEMAKKDMGNGEIGFAEGVVEGRKTLVTARKVGANKPRRSPYVRFRVIDKGWVG